MGAFQQLFYSVGIPLLATLEAPDLSGDAGPYRPPQWNSQAPALIMTAADPNTNEQTAYVFDGVIRAEHSRQQAITQNPVQSGAAIADHAYILPARLVVEIAMSDSMDSYVVNQWSDGPSRSVAAYQTLLAIQATRNPVQIATRLNMYTNMMITEIVARDENRLRYGLSALVTFTQIITANVQLVAASAAASNANSLRPQTTGQTILGDTQVQPVPAAIQNQNDVDNSGLDFSEIPVVTGAGLWSSYNVSGLGAALGL